MAPLDGRQLSAVWIGDSASREFRQALELLRRHTAVRDFGGPEAAFADSSLVASPPEFIVLAQSWPGQIGESQVDRLRQVAPLARLVGLLGSLCEGEARSGRPWPAVERIYWHQWGPWLRQELDRRSAGQPAGWGQPVTLSAEERLLTAGDVTGPPASGQILVCAREHETGAMLAEACQRQGYSALRIDSPVAGARFRGLAAALWDGSPCGDREAAEIADLAASVAPAPLIALMNFPRPRDEVRALEAGAASVVSKPFRLAELLDEIDRQIRA